MPCDRIVPPVRDRHTAGRRLVERHRVLVSSGAVRMSATDYTARRVRGSVRLLRAAIVLGLSVSFVGALFRITSGDFWTRGLGDWIDPYFINYLQEHWRHSFLTLSSPASPPMFFPEPRTLGYSHGLVLYAPFYLAARLFFHTFQADSLALLLVIETGIICLYVFFRKILSLSFVESLLLTAFFVT